MKEITKLDNFESFLGLLLENFGKTLKHVLAWNWLTSSKTPRKKTLTPSMSSLATPKEADPKEGSLPYKEEEK